MEKINYKEKIEEINKFYDKLSLDIYPFISKNRITILKSGFYKKMNGGYYGLSAIYSDYEDKHIAVLINYIYVPCDIIIVPETMEITPNKIKLIDSYVSKGFKVEKTAPHFPMYSFSEATEEYKLAINNLEKFENYDKSNNE